MMLMKELKLVLAFLLIGMVSCNLVRFEDTVKQLVCSGMYSKSDWGGSIKALIDMDLQEFDGHKFNPDGSNHNADNDVKLSYVLFEYKDLDYIGYPLSDGTKKYICDEEAIGAGLCSEKQMYDYIINDDSHNLTIVTSHLVHLGPAHLEYPVTKTGYYCLSTFSMKRTKYHGLVNFQNSFGYLSASEIPKLPAYGILTLCYAIALALYGFQFYKKRNQNQILPLQRYLLAMLGFLTFDSLVVWSYYDLVNRTKNPLSAFVIFYMFFLSFLNSGKITFCLFILLCISLGYGVVRLKLKKKVMWRCKILAAAHFVSSIVYLVPTYYAGVATTNASGGSEMANNVSNGILGLLPMIPVTITLTIYYLIILISIRKTTANLHKQRQVIKLQLYEYLFKIIFFSVILTFAGLVLSTFIYMSMSSTDMIEEHWKGTFFIFDFWPSIVFFAVFMGISWLWRPTETSYMLAISQQVSTIETNDDDDEEDNEANVGQGYHQGHEFELDDLSLISHSDQEHDSRVDDDSLEISRNENEPPRYDEVSELQQDDKTEPSADAGNTLFELGEESDDESKQDDRLKNK